MDPARRDPEASGWRHSWRARTPRGSRPRARRGSSCESARHGERRELPSERPPPHDQLTRRPAQLGTHQTPTITLDSPGPAQAPARPSRRGSRRRGDGSRTRVAERVLLPDLDLVPRVRGREAFRRLVWSPVCPPPPIDQAILFHPRFVIGPRWQLDRSRRPGQGPRDFRVARPVIAKDRRGPHDPVLLDADLDIGLSRRVYQVQSRPLPSLQPAKDPSRRGVALSPSLTDHPLNPLNPILDQPRMNLPLTFLVVPPGGGPCRFSSVPDHRPDRSAARRG
jgi:hypothetical protein